MSFLYYTPFTVQTGQVPSTQTDFPMLINSTDVRFKSTGNGGNVASNLGYDIRPYSDSALTTAMTYELERYVATTGEVIMWIKAGSISDGTIIYLAYGDPTLVSDGSSGPNTFSNSYGAVYHLKDGTTLSLVETIVGGVQNLTNQNSVTATAGQIDGGAALASASSQLLTSFSYQQNAITYSVWAKATSFPAAYNDPVIKINSGGTRFNLISVKSTGKMRWSIGATTQLDADGTGLATLSTATWYYLNLTYDSTNGINAYVNSTLDKTVAANGVCTSIAQAVDIGGSSITASQYWNGSLDEVRYSSIARSANWITTEYNNQSAPGTFYTIGTEVPTGAVSATPAFITLIWDH